MSTSLATLFKSLAWFALILALLLTIGYIYQRQTTAADFRKFPPPGQRVDVGGYSLHLYCTGEVNGPTVVVDAGNGDFSTGWLGIQRKVSKSARLCTYDRAGYGWSDPSPYPRTATQMARELHQLLGNAKLEPPYILVGHSLGGFTMRMFASQYPDEVAGLVLVDAGHEDQLERLPPGYIRLTERQASYFSVLGFLSRFGLLRLIGSLSNGADFAPPLVLKQPPDIQALYLMLMSHPAYFDTTLAELRALPDITAEVRATSHLGDRPLTVLTAENTLDPAVLKSMGLPADFDVAQIQQTWLELQGELAALSTNSTHRVVKDSTHAIELDQPDAVIQAILDMLEIVR